MNVSSRLLAAALVASILGVAVGAEEATRKVQAGAMSFKAPAAWKDEKPKTSMRLAQIRVDPVAGDDAPGELAITSFPGGVGGVEANVKRWESSFVDESGGTPKAKVEAKKGINVDVTRVEVAGKFNAAMPGTGKSEARPNYRLLGAIVMTKDAGYFFKLTGPDKTIQAASKGFDALIESMTLEK